MKKNKKNRLLTPGDKVRVVGNLAGHQQPIGTVFHFLMYSGGLLRVREAALNFQPTDLEYVAPTKKDIITAQRETSSLLNVLNEKVAFANETNLGEDAEMDDFEYKKWLIGKVIGNATLNDEEKSSRIIGLLDADD